MRAFTLGVLAALLLAVGAWYGLNEFGLEETTAERSAASSVRLDPPE